MAKLKITLVLDDISDASASTAMQLAFKHATGTPKKTWEHPGSLMTSTKTLHKDGNMTVEIKRAKALA